MPLTDVVTRVVGAVCAIWIEPTVDGDELPPPLPFTTGPSPSPGAGPSSGFHGMGFAQIGAGTEVTRASEQRRTPSNKKRRGIRILMPAPSVNGFRHFKPPHIQQQFVEGAERPEA